MLVGFRRSVGHSVTAKRSEAGRQVAERVSRTRSRPPSVHIVHDAPPHSFLGPHSTLAEAYPSILSISAVGEQCGVDIGRAPQEAMTYPGHFNPFMRCRNGMCMSGGFDIGEIVRTMVQGCRTRFHADEILCWGVEGKAIRYPCGNSLKDLRVEIAYRSTT